MHMFLKIVLWFSTVALLIVLVGMYKFNILEDDLYVKDENGKVSKMED